MKNISPPVFYYHSVAPAPFEGWLLKGLTIPLAVFEDQLAWLKARDYKSILLEEWLRIRQGRTAATGKEVCLTFDDGLLDNWVYAFPIARKYGMRFTLFVSPECINRAVRFVLPWKMYGVEPAGPMNCRVWVISDGKSFRSCRNQVWWMCNLIP